MSVELLDEDALVNSDLSRFGVIVVGSRAYEIDRALVKSNSRLLEFVSTGGTLIDNVAISTVPEPGTGAMLLAGAAGLLGPPSNPARPRRGC